MSEFSGSEHGSEGTPPERMRSGLPQGIGGPGGRPGGTGELPPRPRRRGTGPRLIPIFLGVIIVLGFAGFSLIAFLSFFLGSVGGGGGASLSSFRLGGSQLALVRINDVIAPGPNYDFWMESLRQIGEDEGIQGVVLRIESPGGSVASSQELYDEVRHLRSEMGKRVYVSMGDVAASGGYYIAAAADRIFANKGTLTGSVGVISTSYRVEELAKSWGIEVEVIKSGRFKDAGSMFRPMSPEEQQMFELLINNAYDQFVTDILAEREEELQTALENFKRWDTYLFEKAAQPTARDFLLQIADGRVYSGEQALELGLVDEIGALNATLEELAADLGLPPQSDVYIPQRRIGLLETLSSTVSGGIPSALKHPSLHYRMLPF